MTRKTIGSGLLVALAIIGAWWLVANKQLIADTVTAYQFDPSPEVAALTDSLELSAGGKRTFYATQPVLESTQSFNEHCADVEVTANVLGCYISSRGGVSDRIYVYDVKNEELAGINQVTAAHETLHAAYQRLSTSEKSNVNRMLKQQLAVLKSDAAFTTRFEVYSSLPESARLNELHSVVGTEVQSLLPQLESYYARYFRDRDMIVRHHQNYSGVFSRNVEASKQLVARLDTLAGQINQSSTQYNQTVEQLESDIQAFNARARMPNGFASEVQFEAERQQLIARSNELDNARDRIVALQNEYNQLKTEYDGLARHLTNLNNSVNSKLAPSPKVEVE